MASFKDLKKRILKIEEESQIQPEEIIEPTQNPIFELEEARYMLNLVANSEFKGRDIQVVYNIALKLQEILTKETQK